jgi:hypothetical protein
MIALISNDPIGLYMQDKISLDTALGLVEDMQRMSKSPKLDFINCLLFIINAILRVIRKMLVVSSF